MASVPQAQFLQIKSAHPALPILKHTAYNCNFIKSGRVRCFNLPLPPQRLNVRWGPASKCIPRACNTVVKGVNNGGETVQSQGATFFLKGLQIDSYAWGEFTTKLMHHAADAAWFLGKWIAVPALVLMALRDAVLAVATANELWIPAGLLVGTLFTGIVKETFSTLGFDFQHNVLPWHLLGFGLFFMVMRIGTSRTLSFWLRVFLYHFTTGGLWQTIRFCSEWKAKHEQGVHEEVKSGSV